MGGDTRHREVYTERDLRGTGWQTTPRIEVDPDIVVGKPVIRGTRITVELIVRRFADG